MSAGRAVRRHPQSHTPTLPHLNLTPHRRGCPRRALFRVFAHPKVFALLFPKNASYDILRAPRGILAILWGVRGEWGFPIQSAQSRAHIGAWKPESRSIYHTRAGNPNSGWVSPGSRFTHIRQRQSQSSLPHPAPAHPHPAAPHPRAHTHAPTPTRPHPRAPTHAPTPNEKKVKKKVDTFLFCAYSAPNDAMRYTPHSLRLTTEEQRENIRADKLTNQRTNKLKRMEQTLCTH